MDNALLCDFYQLNMMQNLFRLKRGNELCVFDYFFRKNPFNGSFAIFCGLSSFLEFLSNLKFSDDDILFLKNSKYFDDDFLAYLKNFKFSGEIYSVDEGSIVFANEPVLKVIAPFKEGIFIESALLMYINHQSLIATKARRIKQIARNDYLSEFGLRRAYGKSSAIYGARSAIVGGFDSTSNVLAAKKFNLELSGTMSHSFVLSYDDEFSAFLDFANVNKTNLILLIDTFSSLNQGIQNAIKVFKILKNENRLPKIYGVRIDSGDLAYISKELRKILDDALFSDALIFASNDLDEYLISDLKSQGAKINAWGVGTKLITSDGYSSLGGVYKLSGIYKGNKFVPKIKISDNLEKISLPGNKNIFRLIDKDTNKLIGDLIALEDEFIDENSDFLFFDPAHTWKKTKLRKNSFFVKKLLNLVFKDNRCLYNKSVFDIKEFSNKEINLLWDEFFRLNNPPVVKVNISQKLFNLQKELLNR